MAIFSSFLFRHSWKKGSGKETDGDKVNSTHKSPNPTTQSAWERLMHRRPRRRSGVAERTCFFVSEDPCDRLQDRGGAVRLSAAQGLGGARPRYRGAHTRSKVHGLAGTHRRHAGVAWASAQKGTLTRSQADAARESPRLGATGGSGEVQDWGGITQGTWGCEDRAAQPP